MDNDIRLRLNNVSVVYSNVIQVLRGVSLSVGKGQIVSLLGSNGAGKSTTLKSISGLLNTENGKVTEGLIEFNGTTIHNLPPEKITRKGIIQVLEGRKEFKQLTIEENLRVGTSARSGRRFQKDLELVYNYFPRLEERKKSLAGFCSGGELQMLVIGRAMMANPSLLLLDEPSLGLAPLLMKDIFQIIKKINQEQGTTILIVEQNANLALQIANYGYVMEDGNIVMEGSAKELKENPDVKETYLGHSSSGELRSFREVKTYRRRKRWL